MNQMNSFQKVVDSRLSNLEKMIHQVSTTQNEQTKVLESLLEASSPAPAPPSPPSPPSSPLFSLSSPSSLPPPSSLDAERQRREEARMFVFIFIFIFFWFLFFILLFYSYFGHHYCSIIFLRPINHSSSSPLTEHKNDKMKNLPNNFNKNSRKINNNNNNNNNDNNNTPTSLLPPPLLLPTQRSVERDKVSNFIMGEEAEKGMSFKTKQKTKQNKNKKNKTKQNKTVNNFLQIKPDPLIFFLFTNSFTFILLP